MKFKDLSPEVKKIWKVAYFVRSVNGLLIGLIIFTIGPLLYEKAALISSPSLAIFLTTLLFGFQHGSQAFLEVPTGAIGDAIGRKRSVIWSFSFNAAYFAFLSFIPFVGSIPLFIVLSLLGLFSFALSYSFFSGSFTAWCVDRLREEAPDMGYEQILSSTYVLFYLFTALGGAIAILSFVLDKAHYSLLFASLTAVFAVGFCIGEMEDERTLQYVNWKQFSVAEITRRMGEILGTGFQVFRKSKIILTLILIYASYMFVLNMIDLLWPVYLRSNFSKDVQPYYWIGLAVTVLLVSAAGSKFMSSWSKKWSQKYRTKANNIALRKIFIVTSIFASLPILFLSISSMYTKISMLTLVLAVLPVGFAAGVIRPCFETLINNYIPDSHSSERATILSFGSLIRSLLVMLLAIPSGGSSGETTAMGWAIPAVLLLTVAVVGNFILKKEQKKVPDVLSERVNPLTEIVVSKEERKVL